MNLENILDDLRYYKNIYRQETYRTNGFDWIDNIQRVDDRNLLEDLDESLIDSIMNEEGYIQISANKPLDWSNLLGFFLEGFDIRKKLENFELNINYNDYFEYIRRQQDINILDKLKRDRLLVAYTTNENIEKISNVYNCIIFEKTIDNHRYILTHGEWFKVNGNYYEDVYNRLEDIEIEEDLDFIEYDENRAKELPDKKYHEEDYNKDLSESQETYILFDQNLFRPELPGNNSVEPCDVFTENKELIHVKRYNGSSSLSHLLAQGIVSASLLDNLAFRNFINEQAENKIITDEDSNQDFKIIYAIVHKDREKNEYEILPFLTMINLIQTVEQLERMQIKCSIKKIDVIPLENA